MRRISALEHQVRDFVNNANLYEKYFKSRLDEWNALCVAMDILGDTCVALEYYEDSGMGDTDGEKYLKLYGLLQAIFLQQDSIRQLYRILLGKDLQPDSNSEWDKVRDLRNLTVGHPIAKKDKAGTKRCFISRATIRSGSFQLLVWDKEKEQIGFEDVDLESLYEKYKSEAVILLTNIYQAQIQRWSAL